jgi:hypothetical protein
VLIDRHVLDVYMELVYDFSNDLCFKLLQVFVLLPKLTAPKEVWQLGIIFGDKF